MNIEEYEKLPIIEKAELCSQTEDGCILLCSRKGSKHAVYKWKDNYFKINENNPQTIEDIKLDAIDDKTLSDNEYEQLVKFLNSLNKYGFETCTVNTVLNFVWKCFH